VSESYAEIQRNYRRMGRLDRKETLELLVDRLVDYDAQVIELESELEIASAVERVLRAAGEERLLVAPELPQAWLPAGITLLVDHGFTTPEIDRGQAVLTSCAAATAATGTIYLVHTGAQGRRALTLLPDHHICVVRREQVSELVPESLARLAHCASQPITSISGPSATSDIEMTRIRGVHGPRRLTVLLYGPA
jgi:L-lactate dehydrogenase complex protein LldG